jgi:hypothetical protein
LQKQSHLSRNQFNMLACDYDCICCTEFDDCGGDVFDDDVWLFKPVIQSLLNGIKMKTIFILCICFSALPLTRGDSLVVIAKDNGYYLDTKIETYEKQGGKRCVLYNNYCVMYPIIDTVLVDYYQRLNDNLYTVKVHGESHNRSCNLIREIK